MKIEPFFWVSVSILGTRLCVLWATWRSRSCVLWLIEHRTPQPQVVQSPSHCSATWELFRVTEGGAGVLGMSYIFS